MLLLYFFTSTTKKTDKILNQEAIVVRRREYREMFVHIFHLANNRQRIEQLLVEKELFYHPQLIKTKEKQRFYF